MIGEDAPAPDPTVDNVIEAETAENFMKRMKIMYDFYWDPKRKREDRVLTKAEYNEIKQRWKEFMPDEEPLVFENIRHIRFHY